MKARLSGIGRRPLRLGALTVALLWIALLVWHLDPFHNRLDFVVRLRGNCSAYRTPPPVQTPVRFPVLRSFRVSPAFADNSSDDDGRLAASIPLSTYFHRMLSPGELKLLLFVFQAFANACFQHNIVFFLHLGSLLGSYRHHGVIPWDDDLDVSVHVKDKDRLFCALKSLEGFDLMSPQLYQWKFYLKRPPGFSQHSPWWPFVDIFFFSVDASYVFDVTEGYRSPPYLDRSRVFPLKKRPFEGALLPAPCDTPFVLSRLFSHPLAVCRTSGYRHKTETRRADRLQTAVPCSDLHHLYPFVFRHQLKDGQQTTVREELLRDGQLLSSYSHQPSCIG